MEIFRVWLLRHLFRQYAITHVVHVAAQSHVQHSFTDALRYTNDNILGTHNLLEAISMLCFECKCVLHSFLRVCFAFVLHLSHAYLAFTSHSLHKHTNTHTHIGTCCTTLKRMIHVSTDEVYGESQLDDSSHKTETSVLCPTNPYAATKAAAELIATYVSISFSFTSS